MANPTAKEVQEMVTALEKLNAKIEESRQLTEKQAAVLEKSAALIKQELDLKEQELKIEVKLADEESDHLESIKKRADVATLLLKRKKEEILLTQKKGELTTEQAKVFAEELEVLIRQTKTLKKHQKNMQEILNLSTDLGKTASGYYLKLKLQNKSLAKTRTLLFAMKDAAGSIGSKIAKWAMPGALLFTIKELVTDLDNATQSFSMATGTGDEYMKMLEDTRVGLGDIVLTAEELEPAMRSLFDQMSKFSSIRKTMPLVSGEMHSLAVVLNKLGVDVGVTARNFDIATRAMELTNEESISLQRELAGFAIDIAVAPNVLAEAFERVFDITGRTGPAVVSALKSIAATAKTTGIEIGKLIGFVEQFDTFEGAAKAAMSLNAFLSGPYLNTIQLLSANEEERIKLIKGAMDASGQSFNQLDRWQRKGIAKRLNLTVSEASKLFNQNTAELNKNLHARSNNIKTQKDLEAQVRSSQTVFLKMKLVMRDIANIFLEMTPGITEMLKWLKGGIEGFREFIGVNKESTKYIYAGITALVLFGPAVFRAVTAMRRFAQISALMTTVTKATEAFCSTSTGCLGGVGDQAKKTGGILSKLWGGIKKGASAAGLFLVGSGGLAAKFVSVGKGILVFGKSILWLIGSVFTPLGLMVAAAAASMYFLYTSFKKNWDDISTGARLLWNDIKEAFNLEPIIASLEAWWDDIRAGFRLLWNDLKGMATGAWDFLTGWVPSFAGGVDNFGGGLAMVGERGPELVTLPPGSSVINNQNTEKLISSSTEKTTTSTINQPNNSELATAINKLVMKLDSLSDRSSGPTIMEMDGREVGRVVEGYLNRKHNVRVV